MLESRAGTGRTVVVASADAALRQRLTSSLSGMRWQVRAAAGGAEAMAHLEEQVPEVLLLDHWLPDLEVGEFSRQIQSLYPGMELLDVQGEALSGSRAGSRRGELLYALRTAGTSARESGDVAEVAAVEMVGESAGNGGDGADGAAGGAAVDGGAD
jgi:CheY-like chemotaxis protein